MSFDFNLWWQETQNALIVAPFVIGVGLVFYGVLFIRNRRRR